MTLQQSVTELFLGAIAELGIDPTDLIVETTDAKFGDYTSNISLKSAKKVGKQPRVLAEEICELLGKNDRVKSTSVAGPGFVNVTVADQLLLTDWEIPQPYEGKVVTAEFSDPNAFKDLHVGHLYTSIIGDGISRLVEAAGAKVHRVNFGGDIGMHAAKAVFGAQHFIESNNIELDSIETKERPLWIAKRYVEGHEAYESNSEDEIRKLNKELYLVVENNDQDSVLGEHYWKLRKWSYDFFDSFYKSIDVLFEKYYPESELAPVGLKTVKANEGIFTQSDGALVYEGEKDGLHTRVFITREGLPTYETKDIGLAVAKHSDYSADENIIITSNDITEYMKVVRVVLGKIDPGLTNKTRHITHGNVTLPGNIKMSSRLGNGIRAVDAVAKVKELNLSDSSFDTSLGAIRYAFLKQGIGADIAFDIEESISTKGNSGPYLQYAHARAVNIILKSDQELMPPVELDELERPLQRSIAQYPDVFAVAVTELAPHKICSYLYDLAGVFNQFYENAKVQGDPREKQRLWLVDNYAKTLKAGLQILGIEAPDRM